MKRLLLLLLIMFTGATVYSQECGEQIIAREHMFCEKGALSNAVTIIVKRQEIACL